MTIADRCAREIRSFHEFLEGWMDGSLPDDAGTFARAESALAPDFEITSPSGETRDCAELLADLRRAHGAHGGGDPFAIEVRNVRERVSTGDHCLLTYEECQQVAGEETVRVSTVLFRAAAGTENDVEWCHLQETWREPPASSN